MLPLLKFYFHEEVRQAAVQAMPELLRSAFLAAEKGRPGADMGYVERMLDFIWPPIMEAMAKARCPRTLHIPCTLTWHWLKTFDGAEVVVCLDVA